MLNVDMAMTYLDFVVARHKVWEARQRGESGPWSDDPILNARKFTNVFRVLDYGTQFVLTDLIDPGLPVRDQLMRVFLYRHTGIVDSWRWLEALEGGYPLAEDLPNLFEVWNPYRGKTTQVMIPKIQNSSQPRAHRPAGFQKKVGERPIFTSAYLVFPQSQVRGTDKLKSIIDLTIRMFHPDSPDDIVPRFEAATTQQERFAAIHSAKGVGDFMSMQSLTDFGYSPQAGEDREDEFVVLGPGARRGALALSSGRPEDTLLWAVDAIRSLPDCPTLPSGRVPSYMDVQNTLCEFSKYVRFMGKPPRDKPFSPAHPGPQTSPVLPEHW